MSGRSSGAPRVEEIGREGLAIQVVGSGPPLFLVPNPQGFVLSAASRSPLAEVLASLGRSVLTFDPPGAFASTRPPRLGLDEMIECCLETLQVAGLREPVDAVAHSQGTIVALALAIRHPELLRRLVLVGAVAGGVKATRRAGGLPWGWSVLDRR
jgi:pimeloyl-ACP methyl ester carboxylesterase